MTALQLLALIGAALCLQLVAGVCIGVWQKRLPAGGLQKFEFQDVAVTPGAWPGWRDFRVVRRAFEDAAQSQCSFHLQPVDGVPLPPFQPGQYLTFAVQVGDVAPGSPSAAPALTRCYSLSDRPDPGGYRITVKRALPPADRPGLPPGAASGHLHAHVQAGSVLKVRAPAGRFFIDSDASVPAVFVAGGIGITPMMSMLRWCLAEQPGRPLYLFYGVRSRADHAFKPVLQALALAHPRFSLHVAYSHAVAGDVLGHGCQHAGRIDLALLRSNLPHGRHQFYICGPPPLMQSLVPALRDWGVRAGDIHFEAFGPATLQPPTPAMIGPLAAAVTSFDVRFSRSGRTLVWDGQDANLLDFAERHGVAVESGCRVGSCGSCQTRLGSGHVVYADPPDHDIAAGHCLLCVGRPQSALVLEA
jgi:ferredoxin-NADP reductase